MFLSEVTDRGSLPALVKTLAFQQARLNMIAENIANSETPGYRTKRLDTKAFEQSLREALDVRRLDPEKPLRVDNGREVRTDAAGSLVVTPREQPVENILFHDGTNMSLERQMADLAETGMTHELATTLLRTQMDQVRRAIRGRF